MPAAEALGLGILPWSPLGRGVLTGKYRTGTPSDSRGASPHFAGFVERYLDDRAPADRRGASPRPPRASAGRRSRWRWPGSATARASPPRSSARAPPTQLLGLLAVEELTLPAGDRRRPRRRLGGPEPCARRPLAAARPRRGVEWEFDEAHHRARLLPQRRHQDAGRARRARRLGARPGPHLPRRHPPGGAAPQDHPDAADALPDAALRARLRPRSRNRSKTRAPNSSASTGTRSSTPWNSAVKSRSAGQPQRREAEAAHAELVEVLGVGAAAHQVRRDERVGVLGQEAAGHRVDQVAVERRLPRLLVRDVVDARCPRRTARARVSKNSSS